MKNHNHWYGKQLQLLREKHSPPSKFDELVEIFERKNKGNLQKAFVLKYTKAKGILFGEETVSKKDITIQTNLKLKVATQAPSYRAVSPKVEPDEAVNVGTAIQAWNEFIQKNIEASSGRYRIVQCDLLKPG